VGGGGTAGFAVGLPVWVFNSCFEDNPSRKIMCLDIEEEEALPNPNEEITGLYGEITAINNVLNTITVTFNTPPNQIVNFSTLANAEIMVAPDQSKGFYWEASIGLVDLCGIPTSTGCVIRWSYRFWNSTQNPAPCALGAGYVCDGNGESVQYEFHGDLVKDILNPVDWMDLWCSPIREILVSVNIDVGDTEITVCDICPFEPCDIIQIVDSDCSGREGGGPGFVTSVVSTSSDEEGDCDDFSAAKGTIEIDPAIPEDIEGCGEIGGFLTTRRARVFKKPDIVRYAYSVTNDCDENGCPVRCGAPDPNAVCVNFDTGDFTFDGSVVVRNPKICYRSLNATIEMPTQQGVYFLRGIDKCGCLSPPSKPIQVIDPDAVQPPTTPFVRDTTSGSFAFAVGAHVPVPGMLIGFTLLGAKDVVIETNIAQDNFSELAVSIDAGPAIGLSGMAFHTFAGGVGSFVTMVHGSATIPLAAGLHTIQLMARGATVIPGSVGLPCTIWATPALPLELRATV
jgi:hypothetical protein